MVIKFVKISWCICVVLSWNELKVRQNLLDSDYEIYMVRLLVAAVNWHKSLQFAKKPNITLLPCLFIKAQVALLPKPKIRQPKNFRKVETATGRAEKCDTIFESHYRNTQICQNKHSWSDFISGAYCAVININPNRAFWFAFALLLLQIIDMQHLQMFPFSSCIRDVRRIRVVPYTWTISRTAELWFGIHYLSPLLFLRPFVVLFFFLFVPNLQLTWSSLTTLAGLSDWLSKIPLSPAWSKLGPANVWSKWRIPAHNKKENVHPC